MVGELEGVVQALREDGRDAAQLRMAKGVAPSGCRQETAVGMAETLGDPDDTVAMLAHRRLDAGEKGRFLKGEFREQQEMWRLTLLLSSQPASSGNPARVTAHHLQNEHPGGSLRHGGHIEGRLAHAGRHIFRD